MSDNLIPLFPTTLYTNNDRSMIPLVESWFDSVEASNWMGHLRDIPLERVSVFDTTLVSYSKDRVETLVDFVNRSDSKPFLDMVTGHARTFLNKQGYDSKYRPMVKEIWINNMRSGSEHLPHAHEGCFMAGTYYTQVPENSGPLFLHSMLHDRFNLHQLDVELDTVYNRTKFSIMPKPGDIMLWPSFVKHSVPKCEFDGFRRGVAFNIVITE